MGFVDDLDEEPPAELVPAAPAALVRKTSEQRQLDRIRAREDRLFEKSLAIVEDIEGGADIDDDHEDDIPEEWIREVGLTAAARRLRVAKDARKNKKNAPVYLEHARATAIGIAKARASQPTGDVHLNFNLTIAAPPAARPIIDIDPEDEK